MRLLDVLVDVHPGFVVAGGLVVREIPRLVVEGDDQSRVVAPALVQFVQPVLDLHDLRHGLLQSQQLLPHHRRAHLRVDELEQQNVLEHIAFLLIVLL